MTRKKMIILAVIVLVGAGIATWYSQHPTKKEDTETKMLRFEFATLPPNDDQLTIWLLSQSGVSDVQVKRDGKVLLVNYQIILNKMPPDVLGKIGEFGYAGLAVSTDPRKKPKSP
jgi:hypothetical protein